jgi:hypothetical protein
MPAVRRTDGVRRRWCPRADVDDRSERRSLTVRSRHSPCRLSGTNTLRHSAVVINIRPRAPMPPDAVGTPYRWHVPCPPGYSSGTVDPMGSHHHCWPNLTDWWLNSLLRPHAIYSTVSLRILARLPDASRPKGTVTAPRLPSDECHGRTSLTADGP